MPTSGIHAVVIDVFTQKVTHSVSTSGIHAVVIDVFTTTDQCVEG